MQNMRRTLLQPTLRMANGGNFFTRLIGGSDTGKKLAGRGAAVDAAAAAATAPAPPPPPPAAPAPPQRTVADIRFQDGGSLRTGKGGLVPGVGKGDKIDALYEPGEFVVSNDMLDSAPGLREGLQNLREGVLTKKGMTPAQADAKAVSGGSLRAVDGFDMNERPWAGASDARAFASQPGPGNPNVGAGGSAEAKAFRAATAATAPVTPAAPAAPTRLRAGLSTVGKVASKVASKVAPGLVIADTVTNGLDTSTEQYRERFGMETNDPSLAGDIGIRALGLASDVGNSMTFGQAGKYLFRDKQPGAVSTGRTAAPAAPAAPTPAPNPYDAANKAKLAAYGTPQAPTLRRIDGGSSPLFTNVADGGMDGNNALMARGAVSAQNMAAADALAGRYASESAGLRAREQYNAEVAQAQAINAEQARLRLTPKQRSRERELDIRESESRRTDATTRRGQDLEAQGRAATAEAAAADKAALRANEDRKYRLDVARLGIEGANKARDDRRAGAAAFDARVAGMVGTDRDGKPDAQAASTMRVAANAFLSQKRSEAAEALKADPGNARARAILQSIDTEGLDGLDEDTMRRLYLGALGNKVAQQSDGMFPWNGTAKATTAPVTSLRKTNNWVMPDMYVTDNGQKIPVSDVEANPDLLRLVTK